LSTVKIEISMTSKYISEFMDSPGIVTSPDTISPRIMQQLYDFMGCDIQSPVVELSPPNVKMSHICEGYNLPIRYIYKIDYNFDRLSKHENLYRTVFCFEVLEHLQNPLLFLRNVKKIMRTDGVLYLSTPNRPRWMWPEFHFNEMSPERLDRWILKPLGLKIVKKGFIKAPFKPTLKDFIGFRPILRMIIALLSDGSHIYKIQHEANN
jgi:2-polyprenyl-3-methyl-5-hydroxy-6-metoxy-1,4-benzoquinol methylase